LLLDPKRSLFIFLRDFTPSIIARFPARMLRHGSGHGKPSVAQITAITQQPLNAD